MQGREKRILRVALRWRQMTVMASRITGQSSVCSTLCLGWQQRDIKCPRYCPFVRGIHQLTGRFPAQRDSYAENVSIWWRHNGLWRPPVIVDHYCAYRCFLSTRISLACVRASKLTTTNIDTTGSCNVDAWFWDCYLDALSYHCISFEDITNDRTHCCSMSQRIGAKLSSASWLTGYIDAVKMYLLIQLIQGTYTIVQRFTQWPADVWKWF